MGRPYRFLTIRTRLWHGLLCVKLFHVEHCRTDARNKMFHVEHIVKQNNTPTACTFKTNA